MKYERELKVDAVKIKYLILCVLGLVLVILAVQKYNDVIVQVITPSENHNAGENINYSVLMNPDFNSDTNLKELRVLQYFPKDISFDSTLDLSGDELVRIAGSALPAAYSSDMLAEWQVADPKGYDVPVDAIFAVLERLLVGFDEAAILESQICNAETNTVFLSNESVGALAEENKVCSSYGPYPAATAELLFESCGEDYTDELVYEIEYAFTSDEKAEVRFAYIAVGGDAVRLATLAVFTDPLMLEMYQ